jgi:hypothetical protein
MLHPHAHEDEAVHVLEAAQQPPALTDQDDARVARIVGLYEDSTGDHE